VKCKFQILIERFDDSNGPYGHNPWSSAQADKGGHMKRFTILFLALIFVITGISPGSNKTETPMPNENILIESDVDSWVPDPLLGTHKWKKFFSDEKHTPSKKPEFEWYYAPEMVIKETIEKLNYKGQASGLVGATLAWVKVVELKNNRTMWLFYGIWPEKRITLFFGIFEKEDGTKYFEDISEMEDIQKMAPGLSKEVLENLFKAISKPWWKVW
jgi:hypothetical protein